MLIYPSIILSSFDENSFLKGYMKQKKNKYQKPNRCVHIPGQFVVFKNIKKQMVCSEGLRRYNASFC